MLKLFLGKVGVPIPTKLHPDLEKYDYAMFKRWILLKFMVIDDVCYHMVPLMVMMEARKFWSEVHAIFVKSLTPTCDIAHPWDTEKDLVFLLKVGCPNSVSSCKNGCCFSLDHTFLVRERMCTSGLCRERA